MKVVLINPYAVTQGDRYIYPTPPLGLLYLATYANREIRNSSLDLDIDIEILDAQMAQEYKSTKTSLGYRCGLSDQEITEYLLDKRPDVVGISNNNTPQTKGVIELAELVRRVVPHCILVLGGTHATFAHETLLSENQCIDIVVRGEGEAAFWKLLRSIYLDEPYENLKGITYRKEGKMVVQPPEPLIEDLDSLPMPDRSLIPYEKYLQATGNMYFVPLRKPVGTVFTSRGCLFDCVFCSTQKAWGKPWRALSAENVVREIEHLYHSYGVREICFLDDQFLGSTRRVLDICNLLIEKRLGISFVVPQGVTPSLITDEVLDMMIKAGFYRICYSVDVGVEKSREYVGGKRVELDTVRELVRKANRRGLWTYSTFVIGFPDEDENDIRDTIRYAYDLKTDFLRFYVAQPYLGSRLYEIYTEQGVFTDTDIVESPHDMGDSLFPTKYVSADRLRELHELAESGYLKKHMLHLLEPSYLIHEFLPKLSSVGRFKYFLRVAYSMFVQRVRRSCNNG